MRAMPRRRNRRVLPAAVTLCTSCVLGKPQTIHLSIKTDTTPDQPKP